MKVRKGSLFSLTIKESDYFNDKNQDKFELVGSPLIGKVCEEELSFINKSFLASSCYMRDKDYSRSIETLKNAFYRTKEYQDSTCISCAKLFQSTITQSLAYIHDDLKRMTNGFFCSKRFRSSFELATIVLADIQSGSQL